MMNEYQLYIKQAWHLLRRNRFFCGVYIIGTGLAISMVMALAVVYHIQTANIAPENHRDRMCYLSWAPQDGACWALRWRRACCC